MVINNCKNIKVHGVQLKRLVDREYKDEVQRLSEKRARENLCGLMEEIVNQLAELKNEVKRVSRLSSVQPFEDAQTSRQANLAALKDKLTKTQKSFPVTAYVDHMARISDLLAAVKADQDHV